MRVCSLFSGIGGIDLGFQQAGFDIVWANEIDRYAAATYRYNFGSEYLVEKNIRKVDPSELPDFDVLVAGFPCQSFSTAGKQRGFDDCRGNLFFEIERFVKAKRPSVIFLENVANLLKHDEGKTILTVYNTLVPYGYSFKYQVMDSAKFGNIPQHRARIFIVAFLDNNLCERFNFPPEIPLTKTLEDIFDGTKKHSDCYYYDDTNKYYNDLKLLVTSQKHIYRIYDSGISRKAFDICPTLTAYMGHCKERIPIILDNYGIRSATPYECLALQGFPADFRFPNIPLSSAYKQCGNSVVVPVNRRIAENIMKVMM